MATTNENAGGAAELRERLRSIRGQALEEIAGDAPLEELRVRYLGKKGALTAVLRGMGALSPQERPEIGALANSLRAEIEEAIAAKARALAAGARDARLAAERLDVTAPGVAPAIGARHPLSQVEGELREIFCSMGFTVAEGPEVETDYYNFQALNIPPDHPARDTQDTFYIDDSILLRSQTSGMQVRVMEKTKPPIRIISPGRVYRSDAVDATHSPVFHQMEGLVVDRGVTMGDLVGTMEVFARRLFGDSTRLRLRPHHFPFTEPSCEVDVSCFACGGKGCRICKGEGWIEILGAGMVHPAVLRGCDIDPEVYSGFAFGLGIERIAMRKWNIDDMRLLYENDTRFLSQFA